MLSLWCFQPLYKLGIPWILSHTFFTPSLMRCQKTVEAARVLPFYHLLLSKASRLTKRWLLYFSVPFNKDKCSCLEIFLVTKRLQWRGTRLTLFITCVLFSGKKLWNSLTDENKKSKIYTCTIYWIPAATLHILDSMFGKLIFLWHHVFKFFLQTVYWMGFLLCFMLRP